ncbi:hypothetical protein D3C78_1339190 [compost metagenome]
MLPPQYATTLSGRLELFSDHLRYRDGRLDTSFDSQETLARVIEDYLQRRFVTRLVQLSEVPLVSFPLARGWRVDGDRYPALPQPSTAQTAPAEVAVPPASEPSRVQVDRRQRFSLLRLLSAPQQYQNLNMRITKLSGGSAEGRFAGLSEDGSIRLSQQRGGAGQATFTLHPDEISRVELLEP